MKLTSARRRAFLEDLSRHGIAAAAARAASPDSDHPRGALSTFRDAARKDAAFRDEWNRALEEAEANIELEIYRRAVDGYEEQKVDSLGRVTTFKKYSDACLLGLARARLPAFRKTDVAVDATVKHDVDPTALAEAIRERATELAAAMRELGAREVGDVRRN